MKKKVEASDHVQQLFNYELEQRREDNQTIFSICSNPTNDKFFACNSLGQISLFTRKYSHFKHFRTFTSNEGQKNFIIRSYQKSKREPILVCGGEDGIKIYRNRKLFKGLEEMKDEEEEEEENEGEGEYEKKEEGSEIFLEEEKEVDKKRRILSPSPIPKLHKTTGNEVNTFQFRSDRKDIIIGGGNNIIKILDLGTGKFKQEITVDESSRNYYILNLICDPKEEDTLFVGGNNSGVCRVFDLRKKDSEIYNFLPFEYKNTWIGTLDIQDNWLICGGEPKFVTVFNSSIRKICTVCPTKKSTNIVKFLSGDRNLQFITCGNENRYYRWSIDGKLKISCSLKDISNCYDICLTSNHQNVFCGKSKKFEVFFDDMYLRNIHF